MKETGRDHLKVAPDPFRMDLVYLQIFKGNPPFKPHLHSCKEHTAGDQEQSSALPDSPALP